jgi:hypothetical protein
MALDPRDCPVTRDHIRQWITGWKISQSQGGTATLRQWITAKIALLNLDDDQVNTVGIDHIRHDIMPIVDYIMLDIASYDNAPSS